MSTSNSKHEFVPCDQVFPSIVIYFLLLLLKNKYFDLSLINKNCSGQFLSSYFWFAVNVNINLSILITCAHYYAFILQGEICG